jgi:hypothetical protein
MIVIRSPAQLDAVDARGKGEDRSSYVGAMFMISSALERSVSHSWTRRLSRWPGTPVARLLVWLLAFGFAAGQGAGAALACPNEQLRSENNSTQLPDCRAYELVSPAEKTEGNGDVLSFESKVQYPRPMQATADGQAVMYDGEQFFEPNFGGIDQYTSARGVDGWSTTNSTPHSSVPIERIVGASANLTESLLPSNRFTQLSAQAPAGYRNLYLVGPTGAVTPLITSAPPHRSPAEFGFLSAREERVLSFLFDPSSEEPSGIDPISGELSSIYFAANDTLTANAVDGGETENNLYRWSDGKLTLVNVLPNGTTEPNAEFGRQYHEGSDASVATPDLDHAVSDDGRRVFWTDENNHDLYMREISEGGEEKTVQVDEAIGGGGEFLAATPSGSRVYFTKAGQLYEYRVPEFQVQSGRLIDITPSPSAEVQGIVGISEDGEYVYFVGHEDKLFVYQPGAGGAHETHFIATLTEADEQPPPFIGSGENVADWAPTVAQRTAEVSPDGRFLAFGSHVSLTGQSSAGTAQIYVYDDETGALSCASCRPTGMTSTPSFILPFFDSYGTHQQRYMLDDGRLFFTTSTSLVAQDTNEQKDVYEWENGEAHLISSGTSPRESVFLDASEDGSNVFFTTNQALVPEDHDEIVDVYDARVEGGFPAPSTATPCTTSDGCQGAPAASPEFGPPLSASAIGVGGNLASPPPAPAVVHPPPTRAQKLAAALKACRKKPRRSRKACEAQARKRYGAKTKTKAKAKKARRGGR